MADIRANLKAHMVADATLTTLIAGRVFLGDAPQGTTGDYVIFRMIKSEFGSSMDGDSGERQATFEIVAWSSWERAILIKDRLQALYHTFDGRFQMGDIWVHYCAKVNEYDGDRVRDTYSDEGSCPITSVFEFVWDVTV